jgi:hypothetical protein
MRLPDLFRSRHKQLQVTKALTCLKRAIVFFEYFFRPTVQHHRSRHGR